MFNKSSNKQALLNNFLIQVSHKIICLMFHTVENKSITVCTYYHSCIPCLSQLRSVSGNFITLMTLLLLKKKIWMTCLFHIHCSTWFVITHKIDCEDNKTPATFLYNTMSLNFNDISMFLKIKTEMSTCLLHMQYSSWSVTTCIICLCNTTIAVNPCYRVKAKIYNPQFLATFYRGKKKICTKADVCSSNSGTFQCRVVRTWCLSCPQTVSYVWKLKEKLCMFNVEHYFKHCVTYIVRM